MVINLADDSKNIFFKMDPKFLQTDGQYKLTLYSKYNNRWLFHYPEPTEQQTQSGTYSRFKGAWQPASYGFTQTPLGLKLTPVSSGDTWVGFSWDSEDVDGINDFDISQVVDIDNDIDGYYIAQLNCAQWPITRISDVTKQLQTHTIVETLAKVVANWGDRTTYKPETIYPASRTGVYRDVENQEQYTYYRDE